MQDEEEPEGDVQRFALDLFVVHPKLMPEEITAGLGLLPRFSHAVGQPRATPKGTPLEGVHRDTRWRHCRSYQTRDQRFVQALTGFVEELASRREFLRAVGLTGGRVQVIVKFLGDGYFGGTIPLPALSLLADLRLDLGVEVFAVPQSS